MRSGKLFCNGAVIAEYTSKNHIIVNMTKYDNETLKIQNKLLYGLTKTSNLTFNTIKYIEKGQTALYKVVVPKQFWTKTKEKGGEIDGNSYII